MKKLLPIFLLCCLSIFNGKAQINLSLSGGFGSFTPNVVVPAYACQSNSFNLLLSANSYFLIPPDSSIYLGIQDAGSIEFTGLITLPTIPNFHFYLLFHNSTSVTDTFR